MPKNCRHWALLFFDKSAIIVAGEIEMYIYYNPNPKGSLVGDCVIRAITKATGQSWDDVYIHVAMQGYCEKNMPSANTVWGNYLKSIGFIRRTISGYCTIAEFCRMNSIGVFVLGTGTHVVAAENGSYFDAWDSGGEIALYYFEKV